MKNKDILLDVIGDTDEKLVPELTAKKKKSSIFKWTALGGVCAAVAIAPYLPLTICRKLKIAALSQEQIRLILMSNSEIWDLRA